MRIGEHLTSNFYRQLKKELKVEAKKSDLECLSIVENNINRSSNWEINPLELYVNLKSSGKRGINSENSITDR